MDNEKFNNFISYTSDAFQAISSELTGFKFSECGKETILEDKKFSVVIGVVGKNNKGRILFETGASTAKAIVESLNDGPSANIMDTYLCLAEFANMYCGRAITLINNKYRGSDLRLTPPAVFAGTDMQITTPNIHSTATFYKSEHGLASLDIGFEGV